MLDSRPWRDKAKPLRATVAHRPATIVMPARYADSFPKPAFYVRIFYLASKQYCYTDRRVQKSWRELHRLAFATNITAHTRSIFPYALCRMVLNGGGCIIVAP